MKAVEFVLNNIDPIKILEYYKFRNVTVNDDSIRSCCEIHKGDNPTAFIWNKSNNLWYCYTGDCHGGDVFTLVQKMEDMDFINSVKKVAEILDLNITNMTIEMRSDLVKRNTLKWLETMKKLKTNVVTKKYVLPFTKYRDSDENFNRFTSETLSFYNSKFCNVFPTEDKLLYNKLVIPIDLCGMTVGVALRDITGKYHPKWFYQPDGLPIRSILYNYDIATKCIEDNRLYEIILVEGIFDVWAYHEIGIDNVVAIFGSSLKKEQEKILIKNNYAITLSFDNDDAGNKCTKEVQDKLRLKADLKVVTLPYGFDPADCTKQQLLECYLKRQ